MLQRALALTLITAGGWVLPETATAQSRQGQSPWLRTDTPHFEIHYLPALTRELDRVVQSAERAYDLISGRLEFVLATKVPLVIFAPSDPMTREQAIAYAMSDRVATRRPHRSRITLPLPEGDAELDPMIVHELTHLLVSEIILPGRGGDGGLPRWVQEGIAGYMVGIWSGDDERLMRELVASGNVPALSLLTGNGGFANARLNDAIGHAAFDYIESRWGPTSIRGFLNALIVPRVDKTYDAVFDLTPAEFDAAFRQYAERRFRPIVFVDAPVRMKAGLKPCATQLRCCSAQVLRSLSQLMLRSPSGLPPVSAEPSQLGPESFVVTVWRFSRVNMVLPAGSTQGKSSPARSRCQTERLVVVTGDELVRVLDDRGGVRMPALGFVQLAQSHDPPPRADVRVSAVDGCWRAAHLWMNFATV